MSDFTTSPLSEKASQRRPGRKTLCSKIVGWRSLLLQVYEQPAFVEQYETLASPDFLIVLVDRGQYCIESLSSGIWRTAMYSPGVAGITAPNTVNTLRWHSKSDVTSRLIRAYIPAGFFEEAAEEFRKAGTRRALRCEDILAFNDPQVTATLHSLVGAANTGVSGIYAESAARHLATHLVSRAFGRPDAEKAWRGDSGLSDRRLRRTLEFISWNFAEPLTIDRLAREAGISRFHFCRLFKSKMGVSPHQHLLQVRMKNAERLLTATELSITEVACQSGYLHLGHFAAAFQKATGRKPSELRKGR